MDEENQSASDNIDAKAKALWGDQWFWPILEELEKFDKATEHLFSEVNDAIADDSQKWAFNAVWEYGLAKASFTGQTNPKDIGAREVGKMIGTLWSICEFQADLFRTLVIYTPEQCWEHDAVLGIGNWHKTKGKCREFAEKWVWICHDLRRKAMELAMEATLEEELKYLEGYGQGLQFINAVLHEHNHPSEHERGKHAELRRKVYHFAIDHWREIEANKTNLSWPELHQKFQKKFNAVIDEDTFKRIFYDLELKGVGKPGRIPSNEIGTPKIPRRP